MINMSKNQFSFEISSDIACFTDPASKVGEERISYQIPTYEALKGAVKNIYWKPTIVWVIDAVRVMNPIQMETICTRVVQYSTPNGDLEFTTYLKNVRYQVLCHYEWNMNRPEFEKDRDKRKYDEIIRRRIKVARRNPIYLGKSECIADVEPCVFGDGEGYFDQHGTLAFGLMYHSMTYPDEAYNEATKGMRTSNFFIPHMYNGIIEFPRPDKCPVHYPLHEMEMKVFPSNLPEEVDP